MLPTYTVVYGVTHPGDYAIDGNKSSGHGPGVRLIPREMPRGYGQKLATTDSGTSVTNVTFCCTASE